MAIRSQTAEHVQGYFRAKAKELQAVAAQAISDHRGLQGSHREEICRRYLQAILPARYAIGRGMVYGFGHRSKEADIVLYDAANYPRLELSDHTFFFAESVRAVIEVKSRWCNDEAQDIRGKVRCVRDIISVARLNLEDEMDMIRLDIASLQSGLAHDGMIINRPHIGTGAIFLRGGVNFSLHHFTSDDLDTIDDDWPDVMLFIEPGIFIEKKYGFDENGRAVGLLELYTLGEDALLMFTNGLLTMLSGRVVHQESPFYFETYMGDIVDIEPSSVVCFPLFRPIPNRQPIWLSVESSDDEISTRASDCRVIKIRKRFHEKHN